MVIGEENKGYNLADTSGENSQNSYNRAKQIELEVSDRCNANSKQQYRKRHLNSLAENYSEILLLVLLRKVFSNLET